MNQVWLIYWLHVKSPSYPLLLADAGRAFLLWEQNQYAPYQSHVWRNAIVLMHLAGPQAIIRWLEIPFPSHLCTLINTHSPQSIISSPLPFLPATVINNLLVCCHYNCCCWVFWKYDAMRNGCKDLLDTAPMRWRRSFYKQHCLLHQSYVFISFYLAKGRTPLSLVHRLLYLITR